MRVSTMLDSNGSNTTAVAAVVKITQALGGDVKGKKIVVTAGTGPVGTRAAGLFAKAGADVVITSRKPEDGERVSTEICKRFGGTVHSVPLREPSQAAAAVEGADVLLNCRPRGRHARSARMRGQGSSRSSSTSTRVPPLGVEGVEVNDDGETREGAIAFGALGIGNFKMKLHKECIARLFTRNDLVLDAETIEDVAKEIDAEVAAATPTIVLAVGIDPGTISIDVCALDDGALVLDRSIPTAEALADPAVVRAHAARARRAI